MMEFYKKALMALVFCLIASPVFAAPCDVNKKGAADGKSGKPSLQDVQSEVQNVMNDLISTGAAIFSGMAAGMQEGAEKAQAQLDSADGTRLISNKSELSSLVEVKVSRLEELGNGSWRVILAFRNANDFPVRLVNLNRKKSVLMLDAEGFAYNQELQKDSTRTLTVASKAGVKAAFMFSGLEAKPGAIRLFDTDFPLQ